jgi:hypothetical protein
VERALVICAVFRAPRKEADPTDVVEVVVAAGAAGVGALGSGGDDVISASAGTSALVSTLNST